MPCYCFCYEIGILNYFAWMQRCSHVAPRTKSPRFGSDSSILLSFEEMCTSAESNKKRKRERIDGVGRKIGMSFDHGMWTLPRHQVSVKDGDQMDVIFHYASSDSSIHSVSSKIVKGEVNQQMSDKLRINFYWHEEARDDVQGGLDVMVLSSLLVILFLLFRLLLLLDDEDWNENSDYQRGYKSSLQNHENVSNKDI